MSTAERERWDSAVRETGGARAPEESGGAGNRTEVARRGGPRACEGGARNHQVLQRDFMISDGLYFFCKIGNKCQV